MKAFKLRSDQLRPLAVGFGGCFATDHITVEGQPVGYMYRDRPDGPYDGGWRFFSGNETQDYVDNPDNTMMFDVNTIANYDPSITPYLDAPVGSAFVRMGDRFVSD